MTIDLRSDTVTRPTEAMMEAIRRAELGDDGREGDPTVRRLEALAAEITGKEAAMFVVSGTMGNLVALLTHTGRGGEVLLEQGSHIIRSEMGGVASIASLFFKGLPGKRGAMDIDALKDAISPGLSFNRLATGLICMETTHNDGGGAVLPLDHMAEVAGVARAKGIPVHTDGARLFNAATALGVPAKRICEHTDTVNFCVSKGLSAPIGSLLAGPKAFIDRARAFRRMVGGNLRQGGVAAAPGIVALEQMTGRLAEDHRTARALAEGIHRIYSGFVDPAEVETNIVQIDTAASGRRAAEWVDALKGEGILSGVWSPWRLRLVTHRHIGDKEVAGTVAAFEALHRRFGSAAPKRAAE
jgi:threonine aldolase